MRGRGTGTPTLGGGLVLAVFSSGVCVIIIVPVVSWARGCLIVPAERSGQRGTFSKQVPRQDKSAYDTYGVKHFYFRCSYFAGVSNTDGTGGCDTVQGSPVRLCIFWLSDG